MGRAVKVLRHLVGRIVSSSHTPKMAIERGSLHQRQTITPAEPVTLTLDLDRLGGGGREDANSRQWRVVYPYTQKTSLPARWDSVRSYMLCPSPTLLFPR